MRRPVLRSAPLSALAALFPVMTACVRADGVRLPPVDHAATLKECGACHLAFPPQMLPARSWEKMMAGLEDHFGEHAGLDAAVAKDIATYLVAHAADAPGSTAGKRFLKGLAADATPLRITETPYWKDEHDEIAEGKFREEKIKSKANCIACHKTADKGEFFEEEDD